jgi:hypothetical protein
MVIVDTPALLKLTDSSMDLMKNNKFDSLYKNFIVPDNCTEDERKIDSQVIPRGLQYLINGELGSFTSYKRFFDLDSIQKFQFDIVALSPGRKSHIPQSSISVNAASPLAFTNAAKAYKDYYCLNVLYDVTFKKFGKAYLMFQVYSKDGGNFEIFRVGVLLPRSNSRVKGILKNFYNHLNAIASQAR